MQKSFRALEAVLDEGARGSSKRELRLRSSCGSEVPALLAVSTLAHENAGMLCLLVTDLGEQKRREQELEDNHRRLSAYAAELQRSNTELSDFAGIAGHDLQQPLRKISTFAGQLRTGWEERLDEPGRNALHGILDSAARMCQLTDALLNYARIHSQVQPPITVKLEQVLRHVIADLEIDFGARIQVGSLPEIIAEQAQMRQLFQNLVSNALKYRSSGVVPEVTVQSRLVSGNMVEIAVRDNGIGFDMQPAERIFRPFQRLVSEAEYDGVGLGLAICQKIVTHHGGTIRATSRPGQGGTFTITLPSGGVQAAALAATESSLAGR